MKVAFVGILTFLLGFSAFAQTVVNQDPATIPLRQYPGPVAFFPANGPNFDTSVTWLQGSGGGLYQLVTVGATGSRALEYNNAITQVASGASHLDGVNVYKNGVLAFQIPPGSSHGVVALPLGNADAVSIRSAGTANITSGVLTFQFLQ